MQLNIRSKLLLSIIPPIIILSLLGGYLTTRFVREAGVRNIDQLMTTYSSELAKRIENSLTHISLITQNNAYFAGLSDFTNNTGTYSFLEKNLSASSLLLGSRIAFEKDYNKGRLRLNSVSLVNGEIEKKELSGLINYTDKNELWYQIPVRERKPLWEEPFVDRETKKLCTRFSVPVFKGNKLIGVSSSRIDLTKFKDFLDTTLFKTLNFIIISPKGQFIYHPSKKRILKDNVLTIKGSSVNPGDQHIQGKKMINGEAGKIILHIDDEPGQILWSYFHPIKVCNWSVAVSVRQDELLTDVNKITNTLLVSTILLVIVLFILVVF